MAGYDDPPSATRSRRSWPRPKHKGVKHVIWLTYPLNVPYVLPSGFPARNLYANHNRC